MKLAYSHKEEKWKSEKSRRYVVIVSTTGSSGSEAYWVRMFNGAPSAIPTVARQRDTYEDALTMAAEWNVIGTVEGRAP